MLIASFYLHAALSTFLPNAVNIDEYVPELWENSDTLEVAAAKVPREAF